MIDLVEERRRITAVLLPRIELLVAGRRAAGITDVHAAMVANLADPESAGLKHLRSLAIMHGHERTVEAAIAHAFHVVIGLT
jgi:hypothetical protein